MYYIFFFTSEPMIMIISKNIWGRKNNAILYIWSNKKYQGKEKVKTNNFLIEIPDTLFYYVSLQINHGLGHGLFLFFFTFADCAKKEIYRI